MCLRTIHLVQVRARLVRRAAGGGQARRRAARAANSGGGSGSGRIGAAGGALYAQCAAAAQRDAAGERTAGAARPPAAHRGAPWLGGVRHQRFRVLDCSARRSSMFMRMHPLCHDCFCAIGCDLCTIWRQARSWQAHMHLVVCMASRGWGLSVSGVVRGCTGPCQSLSERSY